MLYPEIKSSVESMFLALEVRSSIREIDRRIDELNLTLSLNWCTEIAKPEIVNRVGDLMNTKRCLQESLDMIDIQTGIKSNAIQR
jgi:hypothetical protein